MAWVWSLVRELLLGRKAMTNLDCIQRQRYHFVDKGPYSQSYGFSCNHVWMWELDHKEESMFLIVVLEKVSFWPSGQRVSWTRGSSWTRRRSIQSILKEINPEYSLEGLMLELKLQYLDRLMQKRQLNGNDPDVWKDWRAGGEGVTEDKMVGWHHQLNGHQPMQTLEDSEGQRSLACCSPWDRNQSETT